MIRNGKLALSVLFAVAAVACLSGCPAGYVGTTTCLACHNGTSAPDKRELLEGSHSGIECETCHGPGQAHVRNAGRGGLLIKNPADLPFNEQPDTCKACHAMQVAGYFQTKHAQEQAATCTTCHDVHKRNGMVVASATSQRLDNPGYAQLCGRCHEVEAADFLKSTHAVKDVASCGSCHDLHQAGTFTRNPLNNDLCQQCHDSFFLGLNTVEAVDAHTGPFHPVDPAGSGSSRCIGCHLPPLSQLAPVNGPHDHTLFTIPPIYSNDAAAQGITPIPPNSCAGVAGCHDASVPGSGAPHNVNSLETNAALQPLYESIGAIPVSGR